MKSIPCFKFLQEILFNDKKYVEFLIENKIIKQLDKCQYCNSKVYREKKLFKCNNKECRKAISIFKNTFFSKQYLICNNILLIRYFWLSKANYTTISSITNSSIICF